MAGHACVYWYTGAAGVALAVYSAVYWDAGTCIAGVAASGGMPLSGSGWHDSVGIGPCSCAACCIAGMSLAVYVCVGRGTSTGVVHVGAALNSESSPAVADNGVEEDIVGSALLKGVSVPADPGSGWLVTGMSTS